MAVLQQPSHIRQGVRSPTPRANRAWLWVLLLTYGAVFLRFWSITLTPLWGDEAAVYWRTCGSFADFLQILQNDGFAPLHYEFYWALKHVVTLSPGVFRFLPAMSAVLMVPAMYFLARQLVNQKAALVVAAFAAVSAHLGWHAHDAKMYSHMWLFCTLSMGSLLWWMRSGAGVAWWCWVASSVAAVGLHSLAWGVIALQPLVFLAYRPGWRLVAAVAGMALIGLGPAVYYTQFNRWTSNIQNVGWYTSGIAWIEQINGGQTADMLATAAHSNYLFGYDYPSPILGELAERPTLDGVPGIIAALMLIGAYPWPGRARGREPVVAVAAPPWWRSVLLIGAWGLLIPYAFYCASFPDYRWPHELLAGLWGGVVVIPKLAGLWVMLLVAAGYFCGQSWRERVVRVVQFVVVTGILLGLASAIAYGLRHRPPGQVWTSRYIGIVWPAFAIGVVTLLMRVPSGIVRWSVISVLLVLNLGMCIDRATWRRSAPIDLVAADVISAVNTDKQCSLLFDQPRSELLNGHEGKYYLHLIGQIEATPSEFQSDRLRAMPWVPNATTPEQIAEGLRQREKVRRLVVWDRIPTTPAPAHKAPLDRDLREDPTDDLEPALPGKWQRTSAARYPYYNRWGWSLNGIWRRREYARQDAPTSAPAPAAASARAGE